MTQCLNTNFLLLFGLAGAILVMGLYTTYGFYKIAQKFEELKAEAGVFRAELDNKVFFQLNLQKQHLDFLFKRTAQDEANILSLELKNYRIIEEVERALSVQNSKIEALAAEITKLKERKP